MNPNNPDDDRRKRLSNDANNLHINPEYGEQGEGPGEQPVRRVAQNKPLSIEITEVSETVSSAPESSQPYSAPRFSHGEEDVLQYFNTESSAPRPATPIAPRRTTAPVTPPRRPAPATSMHRPAAAPASNPDQFTPQSPAPRTPAATSPEHHRSAAKKINLAATILIVFITVIITAVAVALILLLTQSSKENVTETTEVLIAEQTSSITCTKSGEDDELKAAGDAIRSKTTIIANFLDDDLEDYSVQSVYTYADADAAAKGLSAIRTSYNDAYTALGLTSDPFSSTYAQDSTKVTTSHFADQDDLSFENMVLLNIPQTNGTNPDIDAVDDALSDQGYTCRVKSAD